MVRGTNSRYLRDGTPNPAYVVDWVGSVQVDIISGGALNVKKDVLKQVQGLRKSYLKYYCKFANLLASQRHYTVAVYKYMLSPGPMEKGDYICVNQDLHSDYECFDTEDLMGEHWLKCLKIPLSGGYNMFVLPDSTKEPAEKVKLHIVVAPCQKKRRRASGNLWCNFHLTQRVSMSPH